MICPKCGNVITHNSYFDAYYCPRCGEFIREKPPMTNADRINAMTIEGKAEFLSRIAYGRETPWSLPFLKEFCNNCPTVHCTYESGAEDDLHECDFVDGKCPHGSDIVWWLQQPAEEADHA